MSRYRVVAARMYSSAETFFMINSMSMMMYRQKKPAAAPDRHMWSRLFCSQICQSQNTDIQWQPVRVPYNWWTVRTIIIIYLLCLSAAQCKTYNKHTKILKYTVTKSIPNRLPNVLSWTQWIFDSILWTKINVFIIHNRQRSYCITKVAAVGNPALTDRQNEVNVTSKLNECYVPH